MSASEVSGQLEDPPFPEFAAALAAIFDLEPGALRPTSRLWGEVCGDSLDMFELYVACDQWCPGFELPAQVDLETVTLGDAHHFLVQRIGRTGNRF